MSDARDAAGEPTSATPEPERSDTPDTSDGRSAEAERAGRAAPSRSFSRSPGARSRRTFLAAFALVAVAVIAAVFELRRAPIPPPPADPPAPHAIDAVPARSMLVVALDLRALRSSPWLAPYLGGERAVEGLGALRGACGFDPIERVDELVLVVPERGIDELGIVARGAPTAEALLACAERFVRARGGEPVRSSIGGFQTVRDRSARSSGEIAAKRELVLVGTGEALRGMVDSAEGSLPRLASNAVHAELAAALGERAHARATFAVSDEQRASLAELVASEGERIPSALLRLAGVGLAARLDGEKVELALVLKSSDPGGAQGLADALASARTDAASAPATAMLGAAPLLDRLAVRVDGTNVQARIQLTVREIESVVARAELARSMFASPPRAVQSAPSALANPTAAPPTSSLRLPAAPPSAVAPRSLRPR
jgi:hypothetical protein